jgi:hypothetical protein
MVAYIVGHREHVNILKHSSSQTSLYLLLINIEWMSPEMCVTTFVCSVVLIWILDGSQWGKQNWFILGCTIFHLYWPTILDGYLQRISNICVQYKYNLFSECSESFASQLYMRGYTFWVCGEQILKRSSATGDRTQCLVCSHKPMKPKCTWIFIWIK